MCTKATAFRPPLSVMVMYQDIAFLTHSPCRLVEFSNANCVVHGFADVSLSGNFNMMFIFAIRTFGILYLLIQSVQSRAVKSSASADKVKITQAAIQQHYLRMRPLLNRYVIISISVENLLVYSSRIAIMTNRRRLRLYGRLMTRKRLLIAIQAYIRL